MLNAFFRQNQRIISLIPPGLRKVSKKALSSIGLYNEAAVWLGLDHVYQDDTFIVSYPKSGNTWVRFLIISLLYPETSLTFDSLERYVPDIYVSKAAINSLQRPRFIKSHDSYFSLFPRMIYIYRDGRDVMVSYYFYQLREGRIAASKSFSEFLHEELTSGGLFGTWQDHVTKAYDYAQSHPENVLALQYEEMLETPFEQTRRIAEFCRLPVDDNLVRQAVERCSFGSLRKVEEQSFPSANGKFFRSGKAEQWQEHFSPSDTEFFLSVASDALQLLGYPV